MAEFSTAYNIFMTVDFPDPVGPTTIVVCLVSKVSYNWTTLSIYLGRSEKSPMFFMISTILSFLS